jgi:agmatine deiminase
MMNNATGSNGLPSATGFRMPAEWEPHAATWLSWPHQESDWPGKFAPIIWVYTEIARVLSRHEPINLIVQTHEAVSPVLHCLEQGSVDTTNVTFWVVESDRSWLRDSGPIFVVNNRGDRAILDWHFNAWAKYPNWTFDDRLPSFVAEAYGMPRWQPICRGWRVVLEGGSIDVNGQGAMLTTEECLLSTTQQRNPPLDRADYERLFDDYLGVKKVVWLGRGIVGDDTHGHVDDIARFLNTHTVLAALETDPEDENYAVLQENFERLEGALDQGGNRFEVVKLPMPQQTVFEGTRLPASYANFYIANGVVIVPTFNDPADRFALGIIAELLPDREIVGIHCLDLVWGLGTLHCMTQQEPAAQMQIRN